MYVSKNIPFFSFLSVVSVDLSSAVGLGAAVGLVLWVARSRRVPKGTSWRVCSLKLRPTKVEKHHPGGLPIWPRVCGRHKSPGAPDLAMSLRQTQESWGSRSATSLRQTQESWGPRRREHGPLTPGRGRGTFGRRCPKVLPRRPSLPHWVSAARSQVFKKASQVLAPQRLLSKARPRGTLLQGPGLFPVNSHHLAV